jgi:hypothetical protein
MGPGLYSQPTTGLSRFLAFSGEAGAGTSVFSPSGRSAQCVRRTVEG